MKNNIKVNQVENEEVAPEVLAKSIEEIAKAMKVFNESRLRRKTIITLIHAESKVAKRDIEVVMNNLESLELLWLKPKNK